MTTATVNLATGQVRVSGADISDCGTYRYSLVRRWESGLGLVGFVMLNPSTADGLVDDPTIRRCIGFADAWGFGGIEVVNLFALRATDPRDLVAHPDPIGPRNDEVINDLLNDARVRHVVAAWGGSYPKEHQARVDELRHVLRRNGARCLGKTKAGEPRHPLYLKSDTALEML